MGKSKKTQYENEQQVRREIIDEAIDFLDNAVSTSEDGICGYNLSACLKNLVLLDYRENKNLAEYLLGRYRALKNNEE